MGKRVRPQTRFLFDENLPYKVARALQALDFRVSHVGHVEHGQPARGSSDAEVLAHAARTNQVIVTSNLDMVMLCAEQGQPVVWIDARGRQYTSDQLAALALLGIAEWDRKLTQAGTLVCLRVLPTRVDVLPLSRGGQLAERRLRRIEQRLRRQRSHATPVISGQMAHPC